MEIISGLFNGCFSDSNKNNYDLYINCTNDAPFLLKQKNKICIRIPIANINNIEQHNIMYNGLINNIPIIKNTIFNNKKILIYSYNGSQRSITVICAYLIYIFKWLALPNLVSIDATLDYLKLKTIISYNFNLLLRSVLEKYIIYIQNINSYKLISPFSHICHISFYNNNLEKEINPDFPRIIRYIHKN